MLIIKGKYEECKIFTDNIEQAALSQIYTYVNSIVSKGTHPRIMPDVHYGKGSVVGFTARLNEYIVPTIIGTDIGCGVLTYNIGKVDIDFEALDKHIRAHIPLSSNIHEKYTLSIPKELKEEITDVVNRLGLDLDYILRLLGKLGGGNHFIEIEEDGDGNRYITIHSGSRKFGFLVAQHYINKAKAYLDKISKVNPEDIDKIKAKGTGGNIQKEVERLKAKKRKFMAGDFSYLSGKDKEWYLKDMEIAQRYAKANRRIMLGEILKFFNMDIDEEHLIETVHNYINFDDHVVRKGAISAHKGERVVIPLNMKDGVIFGIGKGNEDWNWSAPHGAGRKYSRSEAKELIPLDEFKELMDGVYSTSISSATIDESPQAYKDSSEILSLLGDTIDIVGIARSIYNVKA